MNVALKGSLCSKIGRLINVMLISKSEMAIIWLNKQLKITNMSVCNTQLYQHVVCTINDLLYEEEHS